MQTDREHLPKSREAVSVEITDIQEVRPGGDSLRCQRRAGFTLLEIMIATAVLTIGLVSIVALFPAAIRLGRQVVEKSNAIVIAQSVAEAVRDGIRARKRFVVKGNDADLYFVFKHDGVRDNVPASIQRERSNHDYYILLPRYSRGRKFSGAGRNVSRRKALERSKIFVYPETDRPMNGGGNSSKADNDADDLKGRVKDVWNLKVEATYRLGTELVKSGLARRMKFPGQDDQNFDESDPSVLLDMQAEVLRQYSYAIVVTASFFDADISPQVREFQPGNHLYHFRVLVYRNFPKPEQIRNLVNWPAPVYELDFEVAP